jgi:hypothetical protein
MAHLALLLALATAAPIPVRHGPGTLHGFPSMSDAAGLVLADGELTQEVVGDRLVVRARWVFPGGRRAEEHDVFRVGRELAQERFSWVETQAGEERRRFEVDFTTGRASAVTHDARGAPKREEAHLDLPRGRAFTGYGTALAVSQLRLAEGATAEVTLVAFTSKPRAVTLQVKREGEERLVVAGRPIACDRYTLHPEIPFPLDLFAGAKDGHLWFTHAPPPALVRAEGNLVEKDDPIVVIDVTPRGPARPHATARPPPAGRKGR